MLVIPRAVDHDLRRPEVVAPVDDRDLGGELRQEEGFLHRRVTAADDHDLAVAIEGAVAGRAVRDAAAVKCPLRLEPELPCRGAGGDDDGLSEMLLVPDEHLEGTLGEVHPCDVVGDELVPKRAA